MHANSSAGPIIGTLNEGSLHAALKRAYAQPGDEFEVPIEGFVADIRRGNQLIEVQTGAFGAMSTKLDTLLDRYEILIVHPVASTTWLERDGKKRKSPKHGVVLDVFAELVSWPTLVDHPSLTLDVVIVDVVAEQVWDPKARRRRGGYRTVDRHLVEIVAQHRFTSSADLASLLPVGLPEVFTTQDLASALGCGRGCAQQIAYCFRPLGLFEVVDRTRSGYHYRRAQPEPSIGSAR